MYNFCLYFVTRFFCLLFFPLPFTLVKGGMFRGELERELRCYPKGNGENGWRRTGDKWMRVIGRQVSTLHSFSTVLQILEQWGRNKSDTNRKGRNLIILFCIWYDSHLIYSTRNLMNNSKIHMNTQKTLVKIILIKITILEM